MTITLESIEHNSENDALACVKLVTSLRAGVPYVNAKHAKCQQCGIHTKCVEIKVVQVPSKEQMHLRVEVGKSTDIHFPHDSITAFSKF